VKVAEHSYNAFWLIVKLLFSNCTADHIVVFLKGTIQLQGGQKVDVFFIAFLQLWLKFWDGIDKFWIVLVRKVFHFHHWCQDMS